METLHARRLKARYRMEAHAVNERARLDRVLRTAGNEMLGVALERLGVGRNEIVCLRGVHTRSRLLLSLSNDALAAEWAMQAAEAIREAVSGSGAVFGGEAAVRYRSRAATLEDLLCSVLRRDHTRAWAWRQLGFWPAPEAPSDRRAVRWTIEALMNNAEAIVPLLVAAARQGLFPECIRRFEAEDWSDLADAALAGFRSGTGAAVLSESNAPESERHVARVLNRSSLLATIPVGLAGSAAVSAIADPLAVLATLECDPTLAARPMVAANTAAALAAKLRKRELTEAETAPDSAKERSDGRTAAATDFGGLLYLLNVVADLEIWKTLVDSEGTRTLAWGLYQLGLSILSQAKNSVTASTAKPAHRLDPAVLAFAGAGSPPDLDEPAITEEEQQRIDEYAARVVLELEQRTPSVEMRGEDLLDWVCRRHCRLLADPGWIAAHFALDSVSTGIRRARLDLNPGYLPWLGTTVMFVYE